MGNIIKLFIIFACFSVDMVALDISGVEKIEYIGYLRSFQGNFYESRLNSQIKLYSKTQQDAILNADFKIRTQASFENVRLDINEIFVKLAFKSVDLTIGKQKIKWGKVDGSNPTDIINPINYYDMLEAQDEKIGRLLVKSSFFIKNTSLDILIMPIFEKSVLPDENSRWYTKPSMPDKMSYYYAPLDMMVNMNLKYNFETERIAEYEKNLEGALRYSFDLKGWDFSLYYYYGRDNLPSYELSYEMPVGDTVNVLIKEKYNKLQMAGLDFATLIGKLGFRAECACFITPDLYFEKENVEDPFCRYAVGIDYEFTSLPFGESIFTLMQWNQDVSKERYKYSKDDLRHNFYKSLSFKFQYVPNLRWSISCEGLANVEKKDFFLKPALSFTMFDGVSIDVTGEILDGHRESFFGSYKDNNRIKASVKYTF
jgi:hypothetical protein